MKLYLIRHGESVGNVDGMEYFRTEDSKIPLTSKGKEQSHNAGLHLSDFIGIKDRVLVVNSPYLRTQQTADEICSVLERASFNLQRDESPLLYERSWGALRDLVKNHKHTANDFTFFSRPMNGESFADVFVRVNLFFSSYITEMYDSFDVIVVVTHGEWIKVAEMFLAKTTVADFEKNRGHIGNCEMLIYNT